MDYKNSSLVWSNFANSQQILEANIHVFALKISKKLIYIYILGQNERNKMNPICFMDEMVQQ